MHRVSLAFAAAVASTFMLAAQAPLQAKDRSDALQIPVTGASSTGQTFAGTLNIQRFVNTGEQIVAVGTIAGTLTDVGGRSLGSTFQTVAIPIKTGAPLASAVLAPAAAVGCGILHLDLGPLSLNLLGLQVDLSQVVLDITAVPGAGNLLGNLLCAVADLLNTGGALAQITQLLNQILGVLL